MEAEKSLTNTLKALPDLLRMESTYGLLATIVKQWGIGNAISILLGTMRKTGLVNSLTSLLSFRIDRLAPNLFLSLWDAFGDREAIISGDKRFTYREMKDRVLRLANGLQGFGLKGKDKVGILSYNSNEIAESFFACSLIGCPAPYLNWHMNDEELLNIINRREPKVIIFDGEFTDRIQRIKDRIKSVEKFVVFGRDVPGMISYEDLISESSDEMPETNFILSFGYATGGATGVPKDVHYYNIYSYALSNVTDEGEAPRAPFGEYLKYVMMQMSSWYWWDLMGVEDEATHNIRTIVVTPWYHAGTVVAWIPWMLLGGTLILQRKADPEEFLRLVDEERASFTFVVPTILMRILDLPDEIKRKYDLSSMHSMVCAAAPCPLEVRKGINELFTKQGSKRPVYCEFYGSTEGSIDAPLDAKDYIKSPKRLESLGRTGRSGDLIIFDEEKGRVCPSNEEGTVYCRDISTIPLIYGGVSEEKTKSAFRTIDGKEWFDEGVRGYLDEDGFIYLTGRKKEMIIPGGVNIYPDEIEKVIIRNSRVKDVAAIPIPDKDLGEAVGVVVQLEEGESATEEEIIEECKKGGLYGYKMPKKVEFWRELPRNPEGKMEKHRITPKYWEDKGIKRRG
ncbi:MAG: Acetyl-coenzyme A synthetase [Candidatus Methanolliviera sp. GoM_oil]|nr:MAG: Acetyl-coenzyme A synthetase [Candidatus Methanolliviera sp. GoM_oil]